VDRVVASQRELIGEVAGMPRQALVDADHEQLGADRLEVLDRPTLTCRGESTCAPCGGERRASLRVDEEARRDGVSRLPQLGDQLRAILGNDELDQRRGVEIEGQRR
jgi:hypothetical protein